MSPVLRQIKGFCSPSYQHTYLVFENIINCQSILIRFSSITATEGESTNTHARHSSAQDTYIGRLQCSEDIILSLPCTHINSFIIWMIHSLVEASHADMNTSGRT